MLRAISICKPGERKAWRGYTFCASQHPYIDTPLSVPAYHLTAKLLVSPARFSSPKGSCTIREFCQLRRTYIYLRRLPLNPSAAMPKPLSLLKRSRKLRWKEIRRYCAEAYWQTRRDVQTRWRRGVFWALIFIWTEGLCAILSTLSGRRVNNHNFNKTACRSDGTFAPDPWTYNLWSTSRFFQVSLGFGAMSFSQAKTVDVIWDIVGSPYKHTLLCQRWKVTLK